MYIKSIIKTKTTRARQQTWQEKQQPHKINYGNTAQITTA
jgi:hypothetical protein